MDTSNPGTSGYETLDRQHQFYYSAAWQIAEELIDNDWSEMGPSVINIVNEHVWGVRHVDDIVLRRRTTLTGTPSEATWYHLTDHQFSTVALIDNAANLVERVTYDAYGEARHHHAADLTGDGAVGTADQTAMTTAYKGKIGDSEYDVDADISRTGEVSGSDLTWTTTQNFKAALPKGWLSVRNVGNTIGYSGYVLNSEISIYTVRFRHYDPALGRWLQRDPLGYVDGMSLYEYVRGNSVNAFDPFGLCSWDAAKRRAASSRRLPQPPLVEAPMGPTPAFRPLGPLETPPPGGQTIVNPNGWTIAARNNFLEGYQFTKDYWRGKGPAGAFAVGLAEGAVITTGVLLVVTVAPFTAPFVLAASLVLISHTVYTTWRDRHELSWEEYAELGGNIVGSLGVIRVAKIPAGPSIAARSPGSTTTVSRWGGNLEPGRWVMKGGASWWNWLLSGKWRVRPTDVKNYEVPSNSLRRPSNWEVIKPRQRIYSPQE